MKRFTIFLLVLMSVLAAGSVLAEESATREEVVAMCKKAAQAVLENKEEAIKEIGDKNGPFVWKNTYVFLMNIEGHMLAHPMIPQLTEKGSLLDVTDKNKENPKLLFREFVDVASKNGEGWVWYMWPKPMEKTPSKKFTFIYRVGFTDMFVGAGIYK